MRVADYIFKKLADIGVKDVFLIVGGGAMHLNDALKKEPRLNYTCFHHEQGAAVAAEGYSRTNGEMAVVSVTSGPGGTNALTGVIGQWLDSIPVLYISGQIKFETSIASVPELNLRQLGDQEINIVDIVRPVTKYAKMVIDPKMIKAELDKAIHLATTGRPGPVWLDVPMNVQGAPIEENELVESNIEPEIPPGDEGLFREVLEELQKAKRPVLVAGHGIRLAGAHENFLDIIEKLKIPVLSTFNGFDMIATDAGKFIGRIGTLGSRGGNFALQSADLAIFLGTRNNIRQVSYNWSSFAERAKKVIIDIDEAELHKPTVQGDILVRADAKKFLCFLRENIPAGFQVDPEWLAWCQERKAKYPVVVDEYRDPSIESIQPYVFMDELTGALSNDAVVVAGNGTACVVLFQAGIVKSGQRMFWNSGCASMGYALPASIGAAVACGRDVVCITGEGSIQMNVQEMQTIAHHKLPIKIFILNNQGYSSIKQTQDAFFNSDYIGCNKESGVSFPDCSKLAGMYGFPYFRIDSNGQMPQTVRDVLSCSGPLVCEVVLQGDYAFAPKLSSERKPDGRIVSRPLEDLSPVLDRDELESNIIR